MAVEGDMPVSITNRPFGKMPWTEFGGLRCMNCPRSNSSQVVWRHSDEGPAETGIPTEAARHGMPEAVFSL